MGVRGTDPSHHTDPHLHRYLHAVVGRVKVTREQEYDLVLRVQDGDRVALDQLIDANLFSVVEVARRFRHCGLGDRDLIAEGTIGLIMAARRVVMAPESHFINVAVWWIQRAITAAVAEQGDTTPYAQPLTGDWVS